MIWLFAVVYCSQCIHCKSSRLHFLILHWSWWILNLWVDRSRHRYQQMRKLAWLVERIFKVVVIIMIFILAFACRGTNGNHKTVRIANDTVKIWTRYFPISLEHYFYSILFGVKLWHLFSAPAMQLHTWCYSAATLLHERLLRGWCMLYHVLRSVKVSSFLTGLWLCDLTVLHEGDWIRTTLCV